MASFYKKKPGDEYIDPYDFTEKWENSEQLERTIEKLISIYRSNNKVNILRHFATCKICGAVDSATFTDHENSNVNTITACDLLVQKPGNGNYLIPSIAIHVIQEHNLKPNNIEFVKILLSNNNK